METIGAEKGIEENRGTARRTQSAPQTGTGKPEALKGDFAGLWSRRIDKGARLIYSIYEETVCVYVLSMRGHYGDK